MQSKRKKVDYPRRAKFVETLESLNRSPNTVKGYDSDLSCFFAYGDTVDQQAVLDFVLKESKDGKHPRSIRRNISSLKTYCKFFNLDINFGTIPLPRVPIREKVHITEDIFLNGLSGIYKSYNNKKYHTEYVLALFVILYKTGMRINELLTLNLENINSNYISIISKGNKERHIPLTSVMLDPFSDYFSVDILADEKFFEFLHSVHYNTILGWVKKYFGKSFTPHCFRHGYTTFIIKKGVSPFTAKSVLGHSSYATTLGYFHMDFEEVSEEIKNAFLIES